MEQISAYQGTVSPGLLVSLMDRLDEEGKATPEVLRTLVSKSRVSDCTPSVRASEILLEKGDVREAREVIRMSGRSQEVLHRSVAEARVLIRAGDSAGARAAAVRAYESDPSYDEPYDLLAELDPEGGWPQRHNIQLVFEGRAPVEAPGQGRMQELYRIYYEWFRGSRESASEMLAGSRYYAEGDRDFMLASARMSVDEGDWHSAEMMYSKLMPGAPSYLRRELAEAVLESGDHRRALELLAECDQTSERTLRDVVRARHASGDRRETMVAVRAYLDSEWAGSDEYTDAVRELIGYGMDEEASSVLKAYVDSCGNDTDSLMLRSELAERAEDCLSALLYATEAVAIGKGSVRARVRRARVYLAMDDPVKAGKECARILSERPADPDALELMAGIQARDGDHQSAASSYRKLLESRPADPDVLIRFAEALVRTGSNAEAAEAAHRAVRIDGSRDTYVSALSALMAAGPNTDASYLCREAEARFPKDPAVRRIRGNIEYAEGDYLRASASFAEAAGEDPGNPVLWYSKGMSDEARGDMESAEEAFDRALSIDPDEPDYWMAKASVREARGDPTGAVRALDRASELDRRSPQPVVRKAIMLSNLGRYGESLRLLGVARCMDPGNEAVLDEIERVRVEREVHLQEERIAAMPEPPVIDCCQDVPFVSEEREVPAAVLPQESYVEPEAPTVVPSETEPVPEADAIEGPSVHPKEVPSEGSEPVPEQPTDPEPVPQVVEAESPHEDVAGEDTVPDGTSADASFETPAGEPEEDVPEEDDASDVVDVPEPVPAEPEEPAPDMAAMYKMAASLEEAGDRRGAMRTIESGLEADPDCTDLLRLKSEILLRSGDQEGSRALATRVLELDPEDGEAYRVRGQARLSVGDLPGALQDLDAAVSRGVDDADVHALRGEALERIGRMLFRGRVQGSRQTRPRREARPHDVRTQGGHRGRLHAQPHPQEGSQAHVRHPPEGGDRTCPQGRQGHDGRLRLFQPVPEPGPGQHRPHGQAPGGLRPFRGGEGAGCRQAPEGDGRLLGQEVRREGPPSRVRDEGGPHGLGPAGVPRSRPGVRRRGQGVPERAAGLRADQPRFGFVQEDGVPLQGRRDEAGVEGPGAQSQTAPGEGVRTVRMRRRGHGQGCRGLRHEGDADGAREERGSEAIRPFHAPAKGDLGLRHNARVRPGGLRGEGRPEPDRLISSPSSRTS